MYRFGYTKMQLSKLRDMDLLYPNTTYIHSSHLTEDEWGMVRDSGSNVSYAPQIELQMGHGWPATGRLLEAGQPHLSEQLPVVRPESPDAQAGRRLSCRGRRP
jgi:cytosine/adenosine deaminase-related metal-dependent hydrolase